MLLHKPKLPKQSVIIIVPPTVPTCAFLIPSEASDANFKSIVSNSFRCLEQYLKYLNASLHSPSARWQLQKHFDLYPTKTQEIKKVSNS
jgi:hypothetical protein